MADSRPPCYEDNGVWIYRASAIGGSSHVLAAARAGYTPIGGDNKWTQRRDQYMAEGVLHEPDILRRVASDGFDMTHTGDDDQLELTYPLTPTIAVRVHPDGIAQALRDGIGDTELKGDIWTGDKFVVEAKAMSASVFKTFTSRGLDSPTFRRYAYQFSVQMLATDLPGIFAVKNRDNGAVEWKMYFTPPIPRADILRRILRIDKGARDGNLNPLNEKCTEFPCPYHFLHGDLIEQEDVEGVERVGNGVTIVEDDMLDALCQTLDEAREREKMAKSAMDTARTRINELLGTRNEVHTGRFTMKRVVREMKKVDVELLKKDGIDPLKYTVTTMSQQLRVTGRE